MSQSKPAPEGEQTSVTDPEQLVWALVRDSVANGRPVWPKVVSGSMSPLIHRGDKVLIRETGVAHLAPGEIVTFAAAGSTFVTHRFLCVLAGPDTHLLAKGDWAMEPDAPWPASALVGRVEAIERKRRPLALTQGWGRTMHKLLGCMMLWEWRWLTRLQGSVLARILHALVRTTARGVAAAAWLSAARAEKSAGERSL